MWPPQVEGKTKGEDESDQQEKEQTKSDMQPIKFED